MASWGRGADTRSNVHCSESLSEAIANVRERMLGDDEFDDEWVDHYCDDLCIARFLKARRLTLVDCA